VVGHVTKSGEIAGPRVLEHMVDTVLYLEGERGATLRVLRAIKNRFGATHELALFDMAGEGMVPVPNPSELFLKDRELTEGRGRTICSSLVGTRQILVEVQALATQTSEGSGSGRWQGYGVDPRRLVLVAQVLSKHAKVKTWARDIIVNVVGGIDLRNDPGADLAIAVSIVSSAFDVNVPMDIACVGELGLAGELRAVPALRQRILELAKMGVKRVVVPKAGYDKLDMGRDLDSYGIQILPCKNLVDALRAIFPRAE